MRCGSAWIGLGGSSGDETSAAAGLAANAYWHFPFVQVWPVPQPVPQAPQFVALVVRFTHTPAQLLIPVAQAHWPPLHTRLPPQVCWQNPQLFLSVPKSTQELPQRASPEPQATEQFPSEQTCPGEHRVSQAPQCWALLCKLTHAA